MTSWKIGDRELSQDSLWRVIEEYEDGGLSPAEQADLWDLLTESREARQIYLAHSELSALLQIKAATQAEEGSLPILERVGEQRRTLGISVIAAAALLLLLGAVSALVKIRIPEPRTLVVEATAGSQWGVVGSEQGTEPSSGIVEEGSVVSLSSGTLRLKFESGVAMVLQGPAVVRFPKLEEPVVQKGWLWVDSGKSGVRLRITTPDYELRNIGTRFGIRVRPEAGTELHLLSGIVEVSGKSGKGWETLKASEEAWHFAREERVERLVRAPDPFPAIDEMLESRMCYPTAVMGQTPAGYWRFGDEHGSEAANVVTGGSAGIYAAGVDSEAPGLRPSDGFEGFEPANLGALMSGLDTKSVITNLDGPGGVSQEQGAVAFWFRREAGIDQKEVLWFAGEPAADGLGPHDEMQVFLSESGRVNFFMENGNEDIRLTSTETFADGAWHHVVATWHLGRVELYLDGEFSARDVGCQKSEWPRFAGGDVRVGKTGSAYQQSVRDLRLFRGMVDELALWCRPLTSSEIRIQYQSAVEAP